METVKAFVKTLWALLLFVWQLPQNLLGLVLFAWYGQADNAVEGEYRGKHVLYSSAMRGGISLGDYIVLPAKYSYVKSTYISQTHDHEYGHTRQSLYLGWLYLIAIGLPSIVWAWLHSSLNCLADKNYYAFYTEAWADKLGGVDR